MFHLLTADVITESGKTYTTTKVAGPHSTKRGTNSAIVMPSIKPIEHFTNLSDGFVTLMSAVPLGESPSMTEAVP
jgi:hypothetical protein